MHRVQRRQPPRREFRAVDAFTRAARAAFATFLSGCSFPATVAPLPFRRLAAAHPDTADAVFRKVLLRPGFTWAEHGEALSTALTRR